MRIVYKIELAIASKKCIKFNNLIKKMKEGEVEYYKLKDILSSYRIVESHLAVEAGVSPAWLTRVKAGTLDINATKRKGIVKGLKHFDVPVDVINNIVELMPF